MNNLVIEKIKEELKKFSAEKDEKVSNIGQIISFADGVVEIGGLEDVMVSELLYVRDVNDKSLEEELQSNSASEKILLVLNIEEDSVKAVSLSNSLSFKQGDIVVPSGRILSVPVSEKVLGRVLNPLLEPLDKKDLPLDDAEYVPVESPAYGVMDRQSVNTPLQTGIKAIDSMTPIGRGQRQLIIGDRQTGKTSIALDTIINQKNEPVENRPICIYASVGQKDSKLAKLVSVLEEKGAMEYTCVVSAGASAPAALQYLAPFTAVSIAEYFMKKGKDVLVVYDDLSKHAEAYRQISLLLRRPPGREAFPGDVFYLHSRLLERACRLKDSLGGGSITALPIIETKLGDVSAYIPTNVISITDGQIFLDSSLFNKGVLPAVDVGISVSRVGSAAQTKAMKKVSGKIKLGLAQFRELEAFMQFSSDLDEKTKRKMENSAKVVELLKQKSGEPKSFEEQAISLFLANTEEFLDQIEISEILDFEKKLLEAVKNELPELITSIKTSKDFSEENQKILTDFIFKFIEDRKALKEEK